MAPPGTTMIPEWLAVPGTGSNTVSVGSEMFLKNVTRAVDICTVGRVTARDASLPFVDEHTVLVDADVDESFARVDRYVRTTWVRTHRRAVDNVLGTRFPGGFRVATSDAPSGIVLEGSHRFARYRLEFALAPDGTATRLTARTFASFPGVQGAVYETLVIRTGLHALAVERMLRGIVKG
jgi:hypothetical protein